jgi:hypothetical protein
MKSKLRFPSFLPVLIACALGCVKACVTVPALTVEQATLIWTGDDWSRGELRDLFMSCVNLCAKGLDLPF